MSRYGCQGVIFSLPWRQAVTDGEALTIDLLYGDQEGGQRVITGFVLRPSSAGTWISSATHHWNTGRPNPR